MITDSQMCKWKIEHRENREKKEEKLDISVSNHEIRFLNFLRFIAFTILGTFTNFIIRPEALVLCDNLKNSLTCDIYETKLIMYRSSHPEVFCKKVFLENLQNSHKKLPVPECLF